MVPRRVKGHGEDYPERRADGARRSRAFSDRLSLISHAARAPAWSRGLSARTLGVLAVLGLVVAFSFSSTLVKRAETAGALLGVYLLVLGGLRVVQAANAWRERRASDV